MIEISKYLRVILKKSNGGAEVPVRRGDFITMTPMRSDTPESLLALFRRGARQGKARLDSRHRA